MAANDRLGMNDPLGPCRQVRESLGQASSHLFCQVENRCYQRSVLSFATTDEVDVGGHCCIQNLQLHKTRIWNIPNQERIERLVSALPEASGFASKPSAKSTQIFAAAKTGCGCSLPRPRSLYCCHDEGFGLPGSRNVDCVGSARLPRGQPIDTRQVLAGYKAGCFDV